MRSMRYFIVICLIALLSCNAQGRKTIVKTVAVHDTVIVYDTIRVGNTDSINKLNDKILKLESNQMTEDNFIRCYKYERLLKYYRICKKNSSQWKYYKGWSSRVFESK
jgi:hypothetical protein